MDGVDGWEGGPVGVGRQRAMMIVHALLGLACLIFRRCATATATRL
jgi:hypothetical protein